MLLLNATDFEHPHELVDVIQMHIRSVAAHRHINDRFAFDAQALYELGRIKQSCMQGSAVVWMSIRTTSPPARVALVSLAAASVPLEDTAALHLAMR